MFWYIYSFMAWTNEALKSWYQQWWLKTYPPSNTLEAVHERKARFRGFWSQNTRLFPHHTIRPGTRFLSKHGDNVIENWFLEHELLTNTPVPGSKGLTPIVGSTEVTIGEKGNGLVTFSPQQMNEINRESALSFGSKMRGLLRITNFRRLQQGNVITSEPDEKGF